MSLEVGAVRVNVPCAKLRSEEVRMYHLNYPMHIENFGQVVKLFNTIQQSQAAASVAAGELKGLRGTGKPTLPAPLLDKTRKEKPKGKQKDNIIGRGNPGLCLFRYNYVELTCFPVTIGKDDFFDMIRSGGIVSKV
jgi:hypothetical protein